MAQRNTFFGRVVLALRRGTFVRQAKDSFKVRFMPEFDRRRTRRIIRAMCRTDDEWNALLQKEAEMKAEMRRFVATLK